MRTFKVVALLGPRQSGKTTLARQVASAIKDFPAERNYFDLEDPVHLDRLENPKLALEGLRGLVVIDEIQRRPDLFRVLRVLADRPKTPARFLILGSASRDLIRQGSESLAGRTEPCTYATPIIIKSVKSPRQASSPPWLEREREDIPETGDPPCMRS